MHAKCGNHPGILNDRFTIGCIYIYMYMYMYIACIMLYTWRPFQMVERARESFAKEDAKGLHFLAKDV